VLSKLSTIDVAVPPGTIISHSLARPCHKCDVCDVTVPFTPLPYVTHCHTNVNLPPHRSVTSRHLPTPPLAAKVAWLGFWSVGSFVKIVQLIFGSIKNSSKLFTS